jgi:3-hydroxymyristoyl/3-hydroxydecanoyl-(acyl carrier protein) dehydratase
MDDILPHRPPFRFVDAIVEYTLDPPRLRASLLVAGEPRAQFPATLVAEAMAQAAAAFAILKGDREGVALMAGLDARFLEPVFTGDQLELRVTDARRIGDLTRTTAEAWRGSVCVATCVIVGSTG